MELKLFFGKLKIISIVVICSTLCFVSKLQCMEAEDNQGLYRTPSLNIRLNGKIAVDISEKTTLHSDRLAQWHISQAPVIADIYNNYQPTGRNVAKALFSVVYKNAEDESFKIKHFPLDHIFINGWSLKDSEVIDNVKNLKSKLHFHKNDYPDFINPTKFMTLEKIFDSDDNLINEFLDMGVLPKINEYNEMGFHNARNLLTELEKYRGKKISPYHVKDLKEKHTHAEKLILIYIDKNIDSIIHSLGLSDHDEALSAFINISSYRDMCLECQKMKANDSPMGRLLERIKHKINNKLFHTDEVVLKVICSGVTHLRGQERPFYENSYFPQGLLVLGKKEYNGS